MKFCKVVVHGLTNDISYDAKLNRSKIWFLGGKIVKSKEIGKYKYFVVSIFVDILV